MPGSKVERQLNLEQSKKVGGELAQDINGLAFVITSHVVPHLPALPRRGAKRNILIAGPGGRGHAEIAAVGLAVGPAQITVFDLDGIVLQDMQFLWELTHDGLKGNMPSQLADSEITFERISVFEAPYRDKDVVFAYGVDPGNVVRATQEEVQGDGSVKRKSGVDKLIEMVREDGGVVVLTKKSLATTSEDLKKRLEERKNTYGDIDIVKEVPLKRGPDNSLLTDQFLWVVKRHKPTP